MTGSWMGHENGLLPYYSAAQEIQGELPKHHCAWEMCSEVRRFKNF